MAALASGGVAGSRLPEALPAAVLGHSAGGHLAFWHQLRGAAATRKPGPPLVLAVSAGGVLDLAYADERGLGGGAVRRFLGGPPGQLRREVSPVDMLPPCLVNSLGPDARGRGAVPRARLAIVHGELDDVVPTEQSTRFFVSATCAGIPAEYGRVRREGHFEILDPLSRSWLLAVEMLEKAFRNRPGLPSSMRGPLARAVRTETADEIIVETRLRDPP